VKFGQLKDNDDSDKWKWKNGEEIFENVDFRCERMAIMIHIQSSNVVLKVCLNPFICKASKVSWKI